MRFVRLATLALLAASLLASTVGACGWEQTCDTQGWLSRELEPYLP